MAFFVGLDEYANENLKPTPATYVFFPSFASSDENLTSDPSPGTDAMVPPGRAPPNRVVSDRPRILAATASGVGTHISPDQSHSRSSLSTSEARWLAVNGINASTQASPLYSPNVWSHVGRPGVPDMSSKRDDIDHRTHYLRAGRHARALRSLPVSLLLADVEEQPHVGSAAYDSLGHDTTDYTTHTGSLIQRSRIDRLPARSTYR